MSKNIIIMKDVKKKLNNIITPGDVINVLGVGAEFTRQFPASFSTGFLCLFLTKTGITIDFPLEKISASVMGKIWSNQGLLPIINDPGRSIFDECPFEWFAGFSHTSSADYIYYLDARDPIIKLYFRSEFSFYGDNRREETANSFRLAIRKKREFDEKRIKGELVFHCRECIVRIFKENHYKNISIT